MTTNHTLEYLFIKCMIVLSYACMEITIIGNNNIMPRILQLPSMNKVIEYNAHNLEILHKQLLVIDKHSISMLGILHKDMFYTP